MKLKEICALLEAEVLTPVVYDENKVINYAFSCDLMSDALMMLRKLKDNAPTEECVFITGLNTNQSIRTAEMLDLEVIVYIRNKKPTQKVIELAESLGITLLSTKHLMFNTNGILFNKGIAGASSAFL